MDLNRLSKKSSTEWWLAPTGRMRVPGIISPARNWCAPWTRRCCSRWPTWRAFLDRACLLRHARRTLGYGFPIGGVAAFSAEAGGVISAGGVGFDISCGVRTLRTGLSIDEVEPRRAALADALFRAVPCGVGSTGPVRLSASELDDLMLGGARWR